MAHRRPGRIALALGLAMAAPAAMAAPPEAPEPRGTLIVGYPSDIGHLNPVVSSSAADVSVLQAIALPLYHSRFDGRIQQVPALASDWSWSDDGKVLRMTLRDDVTYEDGTPVTADDLAFAFELAADPLVASPARVHTEKMTAAGRPRIVDATHIEWHFTEAFDRDMQLSYTNLGAVPRHVFGDADRATLRGHERTHRPLAYGPFRLARATPNESFVLEANPAFRGPVAWQPRLQRVIFRVIPEYSTRLLELEAGHIDHMAGIALDDADRLREEHPELRLVRRGWRGLDFIAWNLDHPLFTDVRVRTALAMALDVDAMIEALLTSASGEAYGKRAVGTVTPALRDAHADVEPLPHDLAKARALLAEAGWSDHDGDGWLDRDGKRFAFTLGTNAGAQRREDAAVLVQAQLKKVGVEVRIEKTETNTFFQQLRTHDFEAALAGWSASLYVDPSPVWRCDTPEAPVPFNFTGYCDPEVDALIDKGLSTPKADEAAPVWAEVEERVYAAQPYAFLWWRDEIVAVHERFENTHIDVLSTLGELHTWEVPADKVKYPR